MTKREDNLEEIVDRLARNRADQEAWTELYDLLWPRVYATAYRKLYGQRHLAEDASQEVFIRVLRYVDFTRLRQSADFLPYLNTIVSNVVRDIQVTEAAPVESLGPEHDLIAEDLKLDSTEFREIAATDMLKGILRGLGPRDRQIVALLAEGHDLDEISKQTGITYSNAAVRVHRLRVKLRNYMKTIRKY